MGDERSGGDLPLFGLKKISSLNSRVTVVDGNKDKRVSRKATSGASSRAESTAMSPGLKKEDIQNFGLI